MPFQVSQFTDYLLNAATTYNSQFPLNPPESNAPDLNAAQLFSSFTATLGVADLAAGRKGFNPTSPYPWISGHPSQDMYGGCNWQRACIWDAWWDGGAMATRFGNCVAITRRHLLMSRHGSDPENATLQWIAANGLTITRTSKSTYAYNDTGGFGGGGESLQFRMLYLDEDLPPYLVCPLINPVDLPSLVGVPVVCYNNYREATCWEIVTDSEYTSSYGAGYRCRVKKPTNSTLVKLWRPFNKTNFQFGTVDYYGRNVQPFSKDAGSGSPFFLVFTNGAGQTQFVYLGSATHPINEVGGIYTEAGGPSYKQYYSLIRDAVNYLNNHASAGNGRDLQPVTVTNTAWSSSLMSGLVAYWKLNEASGNRAAAHGSWTLADNNTVGSASGMVYPLAANFLATNTEFLSAYGAADFGFPGDVTVSAWIYLPDGNPVYGSIVTKDDRTQHRDWALVYDHGSASSAVAYFMVNGGASPLNIGASFSTGAWHHLLGWRDRSNAGNHTVNIQIDNGTVYSSNCGSTARNDTESQLIIGAWDDSTFRAPFDGRIGPVAIWSRVLLPQERNDVWSYGAGAVYPFPFVNY